MRKIFAGYGRKTLKLDHKCRYKYKPLNSSNGGKKSSSTNTTMTTSPMAASSDTLADNGKFKNLGGKLNMSTFVPISLGP